MNRRNRSRTYFYGIYPASRSRNAKPLCTVEAASAARALLAVRYILPPHAARKVLVAREIPLVASGQGRG